MNKLSRRANRALGKIDRFIAKMESAKNNAQTIKQKADAEIAELNDVKKTCDRVEKFTKKILE